MIIREESKSINTYLTEIVNNILQEAAGNQEELATNLSSLKTRIDSLNKVYLTQSTGAAEHCDYTHILTILDRTKEFSENREFYKLNNAIEHALSEIQKFLESRPTENPGFQNIIDLLGQYINKSCESIELLKRSCEQLKNIDEYNILATDEESLKTWAESLEQFGDALEDNIELFSIEALELIQSLMDYIIKKSQKKSPNISPNVRNSYRIRIRNAAGFIYRLVEYVKELSNFDEQEILREIATANHPAFFE